MSYIADLFKGRFKIIAAVTTVAAFLVGISTIRSSVLSFLGYQDANVSISDARTSLGPAETSLGLEGRTVKVQFLVHKTYEAELHKCHLWHRISEGNKFRPENWPDFYRDKIPNLSSTFMWNFETSVVIGSKFTLEFYVRCDEGISNILSLNVAG